MDYSLGLRRFLHLSPGKDSVEVAIPSQGSSLPRTEPISCVLHLQVESLPLGPPGNSTASQRKLLIQRGKCDYNPKYPEIYFSFRVLLNMFSSFLRQQEYEIQYFCHSF